MFYEITREINYAILIEEEDLKNLFNLISKKYKEVEITANCKDKTKLKTLKRLFLCPFTQEIQEMID